MTGAPTTHGTATAVAAAVPSGPLAALALLLATEAGLPVPVPADLIMLGIGVAVSDGSLPWWAAVAAVEAVAVAGTTALLLTSRRAIAAPPLAGVRRRVGLTPERLDRVCERLRRHGLPALVAGRSTPGLRTLTVVAAAVSGLPTRRALPALLAGSTLFVQGHLVLGLSLGPLLRAAVPAALASGPGRIALAATGIAVSAVALAVLVRAQRRDRRPGVWREGACPACLLLAGALDARSGARSGSSAGPGGGTQFELPECL